MNYFGAVLLIINNISHWDCFLKSNKLINIFELRVLSLLPSYLNGRSVALETVKQPVKLLTNLPYF